MHYNCTAKIKLKVQIFCTEPVIRNANEQLFSKHVAGNCMHEKRLRTAIRCGELCSASYYGVPCTAILYTILH